MLLFVVMMVVARCGGINLQHYQQKIRVLYIGNEKYKRLLTLCYVLYFRGFVVVF